MTHLNVFFHLWWFLNVTLLYAPSKVPCLIDNLVQGLERSILLVIGCLALFNLKVIYLL